MSKFASRNRITCDFDVLGDLRKAARAAILLGREFEVDVEFVWDGISHFVTDAQRTNVDEIVRSHRIRKEQLISEH